MGMITVEVKKNNNSVKSRSFEDEAVVLEMKLEVHIIGAQLNWA